MRRTAAIAAVAGLGLGGLVGAFAYLVWPMLAADTDSPNTTTTTPTPRPRTSIQTSPEPAPSQPPAPVLSREHRPHKPTRPNHHTPTAAIAAEYR